MLPGFAECSFSACGRADGAYVLSAARAEYRMHQRPEASILNQIACIAAFAIIALIAIFGHPAAQRDHAATVTTNAASGIQANSALTPASRWPAQDGASR
jgi:hypothetical protein